MTKLMVREGRLYGTTLAAVFKEKSLLSRLELATTLNLPASADKVLSKAKTNSFVGSYLTDEGNLAPFVVYSTGSKIELSPKDDDFLSKVKSILWIESIDDNSSIISER